MATTPSSSHVVWQCVHQTATATTHPLATASRLTSFGDIRRRTLYSIVTSFPRRRGRTPLATASRLTSFGDIRRRTLYSIVTNLQRRRGRRRHIGFALCICRKDISLHRLRFSVPSMISVVESQPSTLNAQLSTPNPQRSTHSIVNRKSINRKFYHLPTTNYHLPTTAAISQSKNFFLRKIRTRLVNVRYNALRKRRICMLTEILPSCNRASVSHART